MVITVTQSPSWAPKDFLIGFCTYFILIHGHLSPHTNYWKEFHLWEKFLLSADMANNHWVQEIFLSEVECSLLVGGFSHVSRKKGWWSFGSNTETCNDLNAFGVLCHVCVADGNTTFGYLCSMGCD